MSRRNRLISLLLIGVVAVCCGGCRKHPAAVVAKQAPPPLPNRLVHVLCYHGITPQPNNSYETSVVDFNAQLQALSADGYHTISCAQLADYLAGVTDIPAKSVIITFDDGKASVLGVAKSILDRYQFKASLFLITSAVGGTGNLSWADVKQLAAEGYEIGSHTKTHLNLTKVPKGSTLTEQQAKVRKEMSDSAEAIEAQLGQAPVALAYPYGNYDNFAMRAAKDAGYRVAFSIDPGAIDSQSDPWTLPRKMIVKGTSLKSLRRALAVEPLHLSGVTPTIGLRYGTKAYKLQARVTDAEALSTLGAEAGKGTRLKVDAQTSQITVTSTLNKGANLVRVFSSGKPRRETGWIVVCDP